ncbi:MAG: MOSC domain-containing protein [Proteobacteria bacterium]|nr:MOSC domain-containing protein [Pseudomonadota bacterium]
MKVIYLNSHPVKGLAGQSHSSLSFVKDFGVEFDRRFAFVFEDIADLELGRDIGWMSKKNFANQHDWPGLAKLKCLFVPESDQLKLWSPSGDEIDVNLKSELDLKKCDLFMSSYLETLTPHKMARHPAKSNLRLVGSVERSSRFADGNHGYVSILNLSSLQELDRIFGKKVDHRRFRCNICVDGFSAWQELDWIGQKLSIEKLDLEIVSSIGRCSNVNVDPDLGISDLEVFKWLMKGPSKGTFGVFARVLNNASVSLGTEVFLRC